MKEVSRSGAVVLVSACRAAAAAEDYPEVLRLAGERVGDMVPDSAADLELLLLEARSFVEDLAPAAIRAELDGLADRFPDSENVRASLAIVVEQASA